MECRLYLGRYWSLHVKDHQMGCSDSGLFQSRSRFQGFLQRSKSFASWGPCSRSNDERPSWRRTYSQCRTWNAQPTQLLRHIVQLIVFCSRDCCLCAVHQSVKGAKGNKNKKPKTNQTQTPNKQTKQATTKKHHSQAKSLCCKWNRWNIVQLIGRYDFRSVKSRKVEQSTSPSVWTKWWRVMPALSFWWNVVC